MSGDYTRFTRDPPRRYDAVLQQQGRMSLDADWNEAQEIGDARLRALARDALGAVAIAGDTPDAFKVSASGAGDLLLGAGRLWVDGLAAEILDGETFSYLTQPFLPEPPPLPDGAALVWLDVWRREVTWVEDPALLDVALGGVDTATRLQTCWQVRVEARDGAACGVPVGTPPSAGRLSARAIAPPAPDDPCLLPLQPGYRGLENRLYRVEVHEGGPIGTARFKWSRDNGSIVAAVVAAEASPSGARLLLDRLGRDPVLRFAVGDWLTLTDDRRELAGEPGLMAQVAAVEEADRALVLDRALPGWFDPDADLATRHARVQRWDQGAGLAAPDDDGLIATAAGSIALEDGIEVSFDAAPAGGVFHVGDHWLFAARVADASIQPLDRAPPRGIVHHHVPLAAIDDAGNVTDCRPRAPDPGRCCCIAVAPGEDIQQAIDALPAAGGCVCLLPGTHPIRETILIQRDAVTLTADAAGAEVWMSGPGPALFIGTSKGSGVVGVRVERIVFRRLGEASEGEKVLVYARGAARSVIAGCGMHGADPRVAMGLWAEDCIDLRVEGCRVSGVAAGLVAGGVAADRIAFLGNNVSCGDSKTMAGIAGIAVLGNGDRVRIADNFVTGANVGIFVNEQAGEAAIAGAGDVTVGDNAVTLPNRAPNDAPSLQVGIDLAAIGGRANGNRVDFSSPDGVAIGIRLAGYDLEANDNIVTDGGGGGLTVGIVAGYADPQLGAALALGATVAQNSVTGCWMGIAAVYATGVQIAGNRVTGRPGLRLQTDVAEVSGVLDPKGADTGPAALTSGIVVLGAFGADVHDNAVSGVVSGIVSGMSAGTRIDANAVSLGAIGVVVGADAATTVTANRIGAMASAGVFAIGVAGRLEVASNRLANCALGGGTGFGISAIGVAGELALHANEVADTGVGGDGKPTAERVLAITGLGVASASVSGNCVTWSSEARATDGEDRALLLWGLPEQAPGAPPPPPSPPAPVTGAPAAATSPVPRVTGGGAAISGNSFAGASGSALVEVGALLGKVDLRFGCVLFAGNHVVHRAGKEGKAGTVTLRGRALSATGNHVRATGQCPSFDLGGTPGPVLANVVSGEIIGSGGFPSAASGFNQRVLA